MTFALFTYLALGIGFAAWALGIAAILLKKRTWAVLLCFCSFALSMLSLLCPLLGVAALEKQDAFSQLYDMTSGLVFGGSVLVLVTLLLNAFALFRHREN